MRSKSDAEQFGELEAGLKSKVLAFLQIKSLAALEAVLAPIGGEELTARLADRREPAGGRARDGFGAIRPGRSLKASCAGWPTIPALCSKRSIGKANCGAAGGGRYDDLVQKSASALPAVRVCDR